MRFLNSYIFHIAQGVAIRRPRSLNPLPPVPGTCGHCSKEKYSYEPQVFDPNHFTIGLDDRSGTDLYSFDDLERTRAVRYERVHCKHLIAYKLGLRRCAEMSKPTPGQRVHRALPPRLQLDAEVLDPGDKERDPTRLFSLES